MESDNQHIKNYVDYYKRLEAPCFAVLITGEWGTGKTHLVRKLLPWGEDNASAYYVTLFGLKTAEEVMAALYAEMYPEMAKLQKKVESAGEATRGVSLFGFGVGSAGSAVASMVLAAMRKEIDTSKVIIFDDLERSDVPGKALLGVINHYVEHHKCRVIVIAHDEKLVEAIQEAKEKIFGQTLRVVPELNSAFDSFQKQVKGAAAAQFVGDHREVILSTFKESGVKSLRMLRHVAFDLARLHELLEDQHRSNKDAMREMVALFSALDFEVRSGRLTEEDLGDRMGRSLRRMLMADRESNSDEVSGLMAAKERYSGVDVTSNLLKDDALKQMLIQGRYEEAAVRASLSDSSYFAEMKALPPWRKVIGFDEIDDEVVTAAAAEMQKQFEERLVTDPGEILHIFALRMMMANRHISDDTVEVVEEQCRSYVDDLLAEGKLAPASPEGEIRVDRDAAHGFGFWVEDEYAPNFRRLISYLREKSRIALERTYPAAAQEVLDLIARDGREFAAAVSFSGEGSHKFARVPVLKEIAPANFVDAWVNSPKQNERWYWLKLGLERRYEGPVLSSHARSGVLRSERDWIILTIAEMQRRSATMTGFSKRRVERAIPQITIPDD